MKKSIYVFCILLLFVFLFGCEEKIIEDNKKEYVTIMFDSQGGNEIADQRIEKGSKIQVPDNPTREGYTFDGWYYGDEKWSFINNEVSYDMTLISHWIINQYTLTIKYNDNETNDKVLTYDYDATIETISNPTREGYTFNGWNNEIPSKMPAEDVVIEAKWKVNQYTLTIKYNDNETDDKVFTYDYGAIMETISNPTREGYTFDGWNYNGIMNDDGIWKIVKDCEISARWIPNSNTPYKVEHYQENINDDNFTLVKTDNCFGTSDTNVSPNTNVYEGFITPEIKTDIISPDGSLVIKYYYYRKVFKVTFVSNGGSSVSSINQKYESTIDSSIVTSREGYTFGGWFTDINLTNDNKIILKDEIFYAYWNEESKPTDFSYKMSSNNCSIIKYIVDNEISIIPKYIGGNRVSSIGNEAFRGCTSLINITIPDSVKSIGMGAFYGCTSLTNITIPNNVTSIGEYAFYGCASLTNITIPDSVTSIGNEAFSGCASLASIIVDDNNATYDSRNNCNAIIKKIDNLLIVGCMNTIIPESVTSIGNFAFYDCSSLTNITIPKSVTSIGGYAFRGCASLTNINIPDSVTRINQYAFYGCTSLTNITIPDSVKSIDKGAFYGCTSLESMTLPFVGGSLTNNTYLEYIFGASSYSGNSIYVPSSLKQVIISDNCTSIGNNAFYGCTSLESMTLPFVGGSLTNNTYLGYIFGASSYSGNSIYVPSSLKQVIISDNCTSIGNNAFYNCRSLTNITIPNNVTSIGNNAFYNCRSLTNITIPNNVTSIDEYAFYGCSSLTNITIPDSVTSIDEYAFYGCTSLTNITIPNSVTSIDHYAFSGCTSLTNIIIPNSVAYIGVDVFRDCSSLTSIIIPDSVTSIGEYAFYGCSSLTNITIPNSITSIGIRAFSGCTSLTNITIPNSVTSIGYGVFSSCASLTSIIIPDSVLKLYTETFYNCTSLTNITIPDSVISIGEYAFYNCQSLTNITIPNSVKSIGMGAFYGCTSLESMTLPFVGGSLTNNTYLGYIFGASSYSDNSSYVPSSLKQVILSNNCTSIDSGAFYDCISLINITISDSVTRINQYAFYGCTSLTNITIPDSVISIGNDAFYGCTSLTNITIPNGVTSIGNDAFRGCTSLTNITILNSVISIGEYAFYNCTSLVNITIPDSVTSIGARAFRGCISLESIIIVDSVKKIGTYAFSGCLKLTIYCQTLSKPSGWDDDWNPDNLQVVWGYMD